MRRHTGAVRQGFERTAQDLRELCAGLTSEDLTAMLDRCLSTRLRKIAEAELDQRNDVAA